MGKHHKVKKTLQTQKRLYLDIQLWKPRNNTSSLWTKIQRKS